MRGWQLILGCWLTVIAGATAPAQDRAAALVPLLPRDANAVYIVRVADILQTPRAVQEQWSEQQAERFLNGESSVPPWVDTLVIGSLVRPSIPEAAWSAALFTTSREIPLESLANAAHPEVEPLGPSRAIQGAGDVLFLEVKPGLLGAMTPAHRQDAGRWLRQMAAGPVELSPFLTQAAQLPGHIVLAMDLQDLLDPARVRQRLAAEESLDTAPEVRARVATQLLQVHGATLAITIGDQIAATVAVSFAQPLQDPAALYQRLFLDMLGGAGVAIDEFDTAQASISGAEFRLQTVLSDGSLRRILSLIVPPPPNPQPAVAATSAAAAPSAASTVPPADSAPASKPPRVEISITPRPAGPPQPGAATRAYVRSVNEMIDHLKVAMNNAQTYERTATWHDNFARKIANLSTVGVDKDVVAYGTSVADKFRGLAASLRGQAVQVAAAQGTLTYNTQYDPGWFQYNWWGGVGWRNPTFSYDSNLRDVRQQQAQAIAAGGLDRTNIWKLIDDERAAMERQLRERYGDDFLRRR